MLSISSLLPIIPLLAITAQSQYTATYSPSDLPQTSQEGQSGYNNCGTTASQTSLCQNVYVNAVDDFCLWGPPSTTSDEGDGTSKIGNVEQVVVSYCLKDGYGTRLIPSGTINGAHFVKVVSDKVSYVQVTGTGDLTKLLIPAGDDGGELDPHSWTGLGNPQGGLVFTNAFSGAYEEAHEWTSFMSADTYCIRACQDGPNAPGYCQHIYDVLSCDFTIPGDFSNGFDECDGDPTDEAPGVYSGSTFQQGDPSTPAPHPAGATSQCTPYATIGGGEAAALTAATSTTTSASGSASASASQSSSTVVSTSAVSNSSTSIVSSTTSSSAVSSTFTTSRLSITTPSSVVSAAAAAATSSKSSAGRVEGGAGVVGVLGAVVAMFVL